MLRKKLEALKIKFDERNLIPVIVQDHQSSEVLMMAWMNIETLNKTLKTKNMTYWSRSRNSVWVKGETSGNRQRLISLLIDCDKDCLLAQVEQMGPACHNNYRSCFYTDLTSGSEQVVGKLLS